MVIGKSRAGLRKSYFLSPRASMVALSKMEVRMPVSVVTSVSPPSNWRLNRKSWEDQSRGSEAFGELCLTEGTENSSLLASLFRHSDCFIH